MTTTHKTAEKMTRLLEIMQALRDPETGCPWVRSQECQQVVPYTLEETYEVIDAIEREDWEHLREELGDLLYQVVFYTEIMRQAGQFTFDEVLDGICAKLERRNPHVFSDAKIGSAEEQLQAWEQLKAQEKAETSKNDAQNSVLDSVPRNFPALVRAVKIGKKAAATGFEWENSAGILDKVEEEFSELRAEIESPQYDSGENAAQVEEEFGDVLFAVSNLARFLKLDAEGMLRRATDKFERRFRQIEQLAVDAGQPFDQLSIDEMERLWRVVKRAEKE